MRTLTVVPVPGRDAQRLSSALPWFPAVGGLIGLALCGLASLHALRPWAEGWSFAVLVAGALLTGGLHLDGLADWADGFWGARARERVMAIMKDSRLGTFGSAALICDLLARWVCVTRLIAEGRLVWIMAAAVIARATQVDMIVAGPYARHEGGTGAAFVESGRPWHAVAAMVAAVVLLALIGRGDWRPLAALLPAWLIARLFLQNCRRRIGGITGDLIGAGSELAEIFVLSVAALL
jgi:adenosylcobinamide-GDP ribazoletransferase